MEKGFDGVLSSHNCDGKEREKMIVEEKMGDSREDYLDSEDAAAVVADDDVMKGDDHHS